MAAFGDNPGIVGSMSARAESVWYVYGVVPVTADSSSGKVPPGLDQASVTVETRESLAALVSVLDAGTYGPTALEGHTADVDWVGPRAVDHDRVLTWVSD